MTPGAGNAGDFCRADFRRTPLSWGYTPHFRCFGRSERKLMFVNPIGSLVPDLRFSGRS